MIASTVLTVTVTPAPCWCFQFFMIASNSGGYKLLGFILPTFNSLWLLPGCCSSTRSPSPSFQFFMIASHLIEWQIYVCRGRSLSILYDCFLSYADQLVKARAKLLSILYDCFVPEWPASRVPRCSILSILYDCFINFYLNPCVIID